MPRVRKWEVAAGAAAFAAAWGALRGFGAPGGEIVLLALPALSWMARAIAADLRTGWWR